MDEGEYGPGDMPVKHKFKKVSNGKPLRQGDGRAYTVLDTRVIVKDDQITFTHIVELADTSVAHHVEVQELGLE